MKTWDEMSLEQRISAVRRRAAVGMTAPEIADRLEVRANNRKQRLDKVRSLARVHGISIPSSNKVPVARASSRWDKDADLRDWIKDQDNAFRDAMRAAHPELAR